MITSDIETLEVFYAHTISPICIAVVVSAGVRYREEFASFNAYFLDSIKGKSGGLCGWSWHDLENKNSYYACNDCAYDKWFFDDGCEGDSGRMCDISGNLDFAYCLFLLFCKDNLKSQKDSAFCLLCE